MDWLEQGAQLTIILTFLGGLFSYFIIRPLNETLKDLRVAIGKLSDIQHMQNERLNRLEGAIERVEKAVVTAHSRIDKFMHSGGGETHDFLGHG